jgi:hypothetical protein
VAGIVQADDEFVDIGDLGEIGFDRRGGEGVQPAQEFVPLAFFR